MKSKKTHLDSPAGKNESSMCMCDAGALKKTGDGGPRSFKPSVPGKKTAKNVQIAERG